MSDMAGNFGFTEARGPLEDFGRQVSSMSSSVGGADGRSSSDIMQSIADEVAAWMAVGGVLPSKERVLPAASEPRRTL